LEGNHLTEPGRPNNGSEEELEIDLRQLIEIFKKWSRMILAGTILCVITAALLSYFVLPPVYEAQSLLMVTKATERLGNPQTQQDGLEGVVSSVSTLPVWTMNTYIGQITSPALKERVIKRMQKENGSSTGIYGNIDASAVKDTNLIQVKVTSGDPYVATKMTNILTEEYVQYMTEHNQDQMSRSVSFLESQKEKTDKELQEVIKALQEYEKKPRGVAVLELEFNSKSQDLLSFNSRLKSSQVEIQRLNSGVAELEAGLAVTPSTISVQKRDQISGTMVLSEESNPVYVAMASQLSEKRAELAEKLGEVEGLSRLVDSMNSDLNALQAELTEKRVEQEKLQREVERLRQTSETLAQKATETQIAKSIDLGDTIVSVVSAAAVPKNPVKPNKKLNMAIALVLGLMVFSLLAFLLEYLDNTIKTPDDVMRELELAIKAGVSRQTIISLEKGKYNPSLQLAFKLARIFQMPVEEIFIMEEVD
jgi:succinoglycan biosynthesis transport protein ExoP